MGLIDLFEREGTDKGQYAPAYEVLLGSRRKQVRRVLEIGIGTLVPNAHSSMQGWGARHYRPGGSLRAWRDYFPGAEIVGVDVQKDTQFKDKRIVTHLCDSTDRQAAAELLTDAGTFDFIIDDGSHETRDQLATLRNFFPALAPGGLYAIEDIGWRSELFSNPALVEPIIEGQPYCVIYGVEPTYGPWKLIVIQRQS
jgi:SAM-dependent methyltransferase